MTKPARLLGPCISCPELPGSPACEGCKLRREFLEQSKRTKATRADLPEGDVERIIARLDSIEEQVSTVLYEITRLARSMAPK